MALSDIVIIDIYVNSLTGVAEKLTCWTPFGLTERVDSDWDVTTREKSGIDQLVTHRVYRLDWDTDFVPMDSEEEIDDEHIAVRLFDSGLLTEDECNKYAKIHIDPANDFANGEALREKLNREGR